MIYEKLSKPHSSELAPAFSKKEMQKLVSKGDRVARIAKEIDRLSTPIVEVDFTPFLF